MEYYDPLDNRNNRRDVFDPMQNPKEGFSTIFYAILFIGFLVGWSIKMYQSWPTATDQQINAIQNQRAAILEKAQLEQDPEALQQMSNDYDSLTTILEALVPAPEEEN